MDAVSMVKSFRVVDLRTLFMALGKQKTGLKRDLIHRAIKLIEDENTQELLSKISDIYNSRHHCPSKMTNTITTTSPPPQEPDIKLMAFPFHETLDTLIDLNVLRPRDSLHKLMVQAFSFNLSEKQRMQLNKTGFPEEVRVVFRVCYTESVGVEEDQYPSDLKIIMNQDVSKKQVTKPGEKPRRPCPPIDITSQLDLRHGAQQGWVVWHDCGKLYSYAVYLVRILGEKELLSQLKSSSMESIETCRARICEKMLANRDSEVATTGLRVSLLCPLAKTRLKLPCRGSGCAHLQCFDALAYLEMNRFKPAWVCPVCDRPAPFRFLRIDGLLSSILATTEECIEEIEFFSDGSWTSAKAHQGNTHQTSPQTDSSVPLSTCLTGDVIDLTQDSDEEL